jgi:pimeloyl-ACP methyl ester carboxylesterase
MPVADNNGVGIHYEIEGEGPPLAILHGFTDTAMTWRELGYVDALRENFRVLLIDARGHGQSDKPHDPEAYSTEQVAADVVAVLDAAGAPKVHLLGYSYGTRIALALARHNIERISSLALGGMTLLRPPPQMSSDPVIEALGEGAGVIPNLWDAPVSSSLRQRLEANDAEAMIALRRCRLMPHDLSDVLAKLTMPCFVFEGEEDPNYAAATEVASGIPHAEFVTFPGLNHVETLFAVDLVLPRLEKFLLAQV